MAGSQRNLLETLQAQDPAIEQVMFSSKFVVAYLLQQDGPSPGWNKANIEGPLYVVRRRQTPRYQIVVKNQFSTNDLIDGLHPDWELDCQKNYIFYKVQDGSKRIRGLWFNEDAERIKVEQSMNRLLDELKQGDPHEQEPEARSQKPDDTLYSQFGGGMQQQGGGGAGSVTVSKKSLSTALHSLADDDNFLHMVFMKLKENEGSK